MDIDPWTIALQTLNVLVLVALLSRFLFRPISEAIDARRSAIGRELDAAGEMRRKADADAAEIRASLDSIDAQGVALLDASRAEARSQHARLLEQARRDVAAQLDAARAASLRERQQQLAGMEIEAGELALDIARRLLERLPERVRVDDFIDDLVRAAAEQPEAMAALSDTEERSLRLLAPRPLTPDEKRHVYRALAEAVGHDVKLQVRVDTSLVAGLELEWPHGSVRNSLRSDLSRIAAALHPDTHARA